MTPPPEGRPEPRAAVPRDVGVVIPAAGAGARFGGRKAFVELDGRPLLLHSLLAFSRVAEVREIVIAVNPEDGESAAGWIEKWSGDLAAAGGGSPPRLAAVRGGARRQDSVAAALAALAPESRVVLVHDAARPLIEPSDIRKVIAAIRETGAAVIGHPATDSVKAEKGGLVARSLERSEVWLVQTPQGATAEVLRRAFAEGQRQGLDVTDEAGLLHAAGFPVKLVEGLRTNIKVTFPEDLALAEFFLRSVRKEIDIRKP
jgi:2-C-methyl-D-erythritol 4-phosphate cytidylyltransferase